MKISQREARRLKKRVMELEQRHANQRDRWAANYPGGIGLCSLLRSKDWITGRIDAARMLGHPVVVTQNDDGTLCFFAVQ
jgi:hypothetical protein